MNGIEPEGRLPPSPDQRFTPALGRGPTVLNDSALRLFTREARWRRAVLEGLDPLAGERILDVGCGTGTLAIAIKRRAGSARVIGLDPDPHALAIASIKARANDVDSEWQRGFAREAATGDRLASLDAITCTLVLHQVPITEKLAGLAAIAAALKPSGRLLLADYGEQRSRLMRLLFRATVQLIDGQDDTQPNADGVLVLLLNNAGFTNLVELLTLSTPSGSIRVFEARRAKFATALRNSQPAPTLPPGHPNKKISGEAPERWRDPQTRSPRETNKCSASEGCARAMRRTY